MFTRIIKAIIRRLKGQSATDVHKEWLLQHGLRIGEKVDCFIGADTTILPNVHIGEWSIIGAGSLVTKDIPPHCVAAGNPARVICTVEEFRAKHEEGLRTHYVSHKPWRAWADATPEEWAALREQCAHTYAYVTRREDI